MPGLCKSCERYPLQTSTSSECSLFRYIQRTTIPINDAIHRPSRTGVSKQIRYKRKMYATLYTLIQKELTNYRIDDNIIRIIIIFALPRIDICLCQRSLIVEQIGVWYNWQNDYFRMPILCKSCQSRRRRKVSKFYKY